MAKIKIEGIVKKQLVLFFVVDTSGSMFGEKIGAVNTAIREALNDDEFKSAGGADADILVAVLEFSNGCRWITPIPQPVESYRWNELSAEGGTDLGAACRELSSKLSRDSFLNAPGGSAAPVILLLSDGEPTDDFDAGLAVLKGNKLYKQSIRMACAIGDDANLDVLAAFTSNKESVLKVHTPDALRKWIRVVSLTTSKVGSKSQPQSDGSGPDVQAAAIEAVTSAMENDSTLVADAVADDDWN